MKKMLLVYNPVSGSANFRKRLDGIVEAFQRRGILLTLYRTRAEDSAEEFSDCVKISDSQGIIIAGGDGTLHRVVNLLMKLEIDLPIGVIGSGTSNDFATHLDITDTEKYFDTIAEGVTRPVDLGFVNGEYFINVASAGVLTSIAHEVDSRQKNSLGKLAYYIHGFGEIPKFKSVPLDIIADGETFNAEVFLFLVLNSPAVAGIKRVIDGARIDDGKLDFIALRKCNPRSLLQLMQKLLSGKCVDNDPNVLYIQAREFKISSAANLISDIDGEIGNPLPLRIQNIRHALNFFGVTIEGF